MEWGCKLAPKVNWGPQSCPESPLALQGPHQGWALSQPHRDLPNRRASLWWLILRGLRWVCLQHTFLLFPFMWVCIDFLTSTTSLLQDSYHGNTCWWQTKKKNVILQWGGCSCLSVSLSHSWIRGMSLFLLLSRLESDPSFLHLDRLIWKLLSAVSLGKMQLCWLLEHLLSNDFY